MGRLVVALVLLVLSRHCASADVVELTSGERVEGALKEATSAGVEIEVADQSIRFEANKVRAIYFGSPARPPAPAPATSGVSVQPPTKPASPAAGALQLLQSLRSAVAGGMTLSEYEGRVNNTAPLVQLYLAGASAPPGARDIRDAMRYYVLAEWAWSNQGTTSRTVWLKKDEALARCPAYQEFARDMQSKGEAYYAERMKSYIAIADGVIRVLWSCADEKIAEAEKVAVNAKK
jgi:hypothetical protein